MRSAAVAMEDKAKHNARHPDRYDLRKYCAMLDESKPSGTFMRITRAQEFGKLIR
jgi:hypothetical protein